MQQTSLTTDSDFHNDRPDHRAALIEALRSEGFDAYEYNSGGGTMHVVADLVNGPGDDLLQIATGSIDSPCDVSIMGWNVNGNVDSPHWIQASTLRAAVAAFKVFFADRETWIQRFKAGELDN